MTATRADGLLLVTMEPPAALEEEFNDWYDSEHFPQRRALPGVLSASRWACLDGWPRWLALYDLESVAAVETPEYRAVSGAQSTPWSKRILPRTLGRERVVARRLADAGRPPALLSPTTRLLAARYPGEAVDASHRAAVAASLAGAGARFVHWFQATDADAGLWLLAGFAHPVALAALAPLAGRCGETGATLFNLYAPYRRS